MLKKLFLSLHYHLLFITVLLIVNVYLSITYNSWLWFARSGSIISLSGATLGLRRLIRLGIDKFFIAESSFDGGIYLPTPEMIDEEIQMQKDVVAMRTGYLIIILGTIIWAYGDLIAFAT